MRKLLEGMQSGLFCALLLGIVWPEFLPQTPLAKECKPETSLFQAPRESAKKVRHLWKVIQHSEKCLLLPVDSIDCLGHIYL